MTFPIVAAANNSSGRTTSHTVALPTGIVSGNLLLIFFHCHDSDTVTFPAGWTKFFDIVYSGQESHVGAWRKADGTEGASITVTTVGSQYAVHISYRITGAADPTIQPPEVSTGVIGSSTNPDSDALTPTGGAKDYLWFSIEGHALASTPTAYPTNYSNGKSYVCSTVATLSVARRELNATSENPGTFSFSSAPLFWCACTVAVHPPIMPTGKIFIVDKDNNVFRIAPSTMTEEKRLDVS